MEAAFSVVIAPPGGPNINISVARWAENVVNNLVSQANLELARNIIALSGFESLIEAVKSDLVVLDGPTTDFVMGFFNAMSAEQKMAHIRDLRNALRVSHTPKYSISIDFEPGNMPARDGDGADGDGADGDGADGDYGAAGDGAHGDGAHGHGAGADGDGASGDGGSEYSDGPADLPGGGDLPGGDVPAADRPAGGPNPINVTLPAWINTHPAVRSLLSTFLSENPNVRVRFEG